MRHLEYLRQRYRMIMGYAGALWVVVGAFILSPLLGLPAYPEEWSIAPGFLIPGLVLMAVGVALWHVLQPEGGEGLTWHEGTVIVILAWLPALLVGALPFIFISGLTVTQAMFEATSGWTTTGLSVVDVTTAPRLILLYRSILQLAGGAGFVILMLSALAGPAGTGLSAAEGRREQLAPNVRRSAAIVLRLYSGYVIFGVVVLYLAGMSWFDAVNHAFAALSTGGFSTRAASIGYWDSPTVEAATIVLMLLGTMNFLTAYTLLRGKLRAAVRNGEMRFLGLFTPVCALILFAGVTWHLYPSLGKSIRVAIFEAVTAISTTGFSTVSYIEWTGLGWLVLIVLMLIGGGTGSTAGGIKQYRVYVLYRALVWELRRLFLPDNTVTEPDVWRGERRHFLSDTRIREIGVFVFLHLAVFVIGSGILAAYGYSLRESLFEFASTVGTVGLSAGVTSPDAPAGLLWTQILGMFLGRLEFFTVIVGGTKLLSDAGSLLGLRKG